MPLRPSLITPAHSLAQLLVQFSNDAPPVNHLVVPGEIILHQQLLPFVADIFDILMAPMSTGESDEQYDTPEMLIKFGPPDIKL